MTIDNGVHQCRPHLVGASPMNGGGESSGMAKGIRSPANVSLSTSFTFRASAMVRAL